MTIRNIRLHVLTASIGRMIVAGLLLFFGASLFHTSPASARRQPVQIVVAAAASMSTALETARGEFEQLHPHVQIEFNFASTGALQRQIEAGAPMDLFIAAAPASMDHLVERGLARRADVVTLASNQIVLVRPRFAESRIEDWTDLTEAVVQRVAIGNPDHVPAGQYGRSVLQSLGLWEELQARIILAENVRQVVNYVARGEVDAGIVYTSDVAASDRILAVAEAPADSHPPVIYPIVILPKSRQTEAAHLFAGYLLSPPGQDILARFGFRPPAD